MKWEGERDGDGDGDGADTVAGQHRAANRKRETRNQA